MKNIKTPSRREFLASWKVLRKKVLRTIPKRTGDKSLYTKAVVVITIWLLPFLLFLVLGTSYLLSGILAVICGIGMSAVGMNVMHDASHGAFSSRKTVNTFFSKIIILLAGDDENWKKQHVHIHHVDTNIHTHDDDLDTKGMFRFTKEQSWKWWHRLQAWYALPAYSLMTLMWATTKDWFQKYRYFKRDMTLTRKDKLIKFIELGLKKSLYYSVWIGLPLVLGISWKFVLVFFLVKHLVAGLLLTLTFQLAHVVKKAQSFDADYHQVDKLTHQLVTSCNFATQSKIVTWFTGGLNFQKEHHVFPEISHSYYSKISNDLRNFCLENKTPYTEYRTLWSAIVAHFTYLSELSKKPQLA